jgi:hypothetical protein
MAALKPSGLLANALKRAPQITMNAESVGAFSFVNSPAPFLIADRQDSQVKEVSTEHAVIVPSVRIGK